MLCHSRERVVVQICVATKTVLIQHHVGFAGSLPQDLTRCLVVGAHILHKRGNSPSRGAQLHGVFIIRVYLNPQILLRLSVLHHGSRCGFHRPGGAFFSRLGEDGFGREIFLADRLPWGTALGITVEALTACRGRPFVHLGVCVVCKPGFFCCTR